MSVRNKRQPEKEMRRLLGWANGIRLVSQRRRRRRRKQMTDRFVSSNDLQLVLLVSHLVAAGLGLAYDV